MVILRSQNKITDFFMILAWASPFKFTEDHKLLGSVVMMAVVIVSELVVVVLVMMMVVV